LTYFWYRGGLRERARLFKRRSLLAADGFFDLKTSEGWMQWIRDLATAEKYHVGTLDAVRTLG